MNAYLKSDSLEFLSEELLLNVMNNVSSSSLEVQNKQTNTWCTACFSGNYQDKTAQKNGCPEKMKEGMFP